MSDALDHATRLLRDAATHADRGAPSAHEDAHIRALEQALSNRKSEVQGRERARRLAYAAAALCTLSSGAYLLLHGHPAGSPAAAPVPGAMPALAAGQKVRTASDALAFEDTTLSVVRVLPHSELHAQSVGEHRTYLLQQGAVDAKVSKLRPGERFVVRTDDTEVEVRGTRFTVQREEGALCNLGHTRVFVQEGVVLVRHAGSEVAVPAGDFFPHCAPIAAPTAAPTAEPEPPTTHPSSRVRGAAPTPSLPNSKSQLAEQNDLFSEAMAAKAKGQVALADTKFSQLLQRYPGSPLAENAYAQRMSLWSEADSTKAKEAARRYLRAFPQGFAKARAEALLGTSP